jgi:hypothetical protein
MDWFSITFIPENTSPAKRQNLPISPVMFEIILDRFIGGVVQNYHGGFKKPSMANTGFFHKIFHKTFIQNDANLWPQNQK